MRRLIGSIYLALIVLFAVADQTLAQTAQKSEELMPEAILIVNDSFMVAKARLDWYAMAKCLHPDELTKLRDGYWLPFQVMTLDSNEYTALSQLKAKLAPDGGLHRPAADSFFADFMTGLLSKAPGAAESFTTAKSEVIGGVVENDTLYHLVTRTSLTYQGRNESRVEAVTFRRYHREWKVRVSSSFKMSAEPTFTVKQGKQ